MNINGLLTMSCTLERRTNTVDDYGSSTPSWFSVATNVKCLIQSGQIFTGKYNYTSIGGEIANQYCGYFDSNQDILVGDRIICSYFSPSTLIVNSVNPQVNAKTGKVSHKECFLIVET